LLSVFSMLTMVVVALQNPLRKSEENISYYLLKTIPLGTDMREAIQIIEGKDEWKIRWVDEEDGFVVGPYGPDTGRAHDGYRGVGEKSMRVYLGYYYKYFFIQTDVSAFFAFDENSKLIEIAIDKSMNVL